MNGSVAVGEPGHVGSLRSELDRFDGASRNGPGVADTGALQRRIARGEEELRQTAEALQLARAAADRQANRFRRVFDLAPDPLFLVDARGMVVDGNAAAAELVPRPEAGWSGLSLAQCLHPGDVAGFESALARCEHEPCRVRLRFRARSGRIVRGSVRGVAIGEDGESLWTARLERGASPVDGRPPPATAQVEERLQQRIKELEQELTATARQVEAERHVREDAQSLATTQRFAMAIVAHEATHLARCVASWAAPLATMVPGAAGEGLRAIAWSIEVELEVLRDLVDVSRIATRQLRGSFVGVDLVNVTRRVIAALAPRAEAGGVEIRGGVPGPMMVQGEPTRIAQIVLGLVGTSIDLAGRGGHVALHGELTEVGASIVIERSGRDLRRDELDWNLDRLHAEPDLPVVGRSPGMVLFVARQLVELHGGRLSSEPTRSGTLPTLRLAFPRPRGDGGPPVSWR